MDTRLPRRPRPSTWRDGRLGPFVPARLRSRRTVPLVRLERNARAGGARRGGRRRGSSRAEGEEAMATSAFRRIDAPPSARGGDVDVGMHGPILRPGATWIEMSRRSSLATRSHTSFGLDTGGWSRCSARSWPGSTRAPRALPQELKRDQGASRRHSRPGARYRALVARFKGSHEHGVGGAFPRPEGSSEISGVFGSWGRRPLGADVPRGRRGRTTSARTVNVGGMVSAARAIVRDGPMVCRRDRRRASGASTASAS